MTDRIAQSADGKQHVFPEGTPDDVIDRAMADYAASGGVRDRFNSEMRSATPAEGAYMEGRIAAGAGTRATGAESNRAAGFQGATLSFGDEAVSAVKDWLGIEPYDVSMARFRGELEGRQEVAPGQTLAAELGGGALTSGPALGKAVLTKAPALIRMGKGALTGGTLGGISGAGAQEGAENRLVGGATGAGLGMVVGAAIPGVMGLKNALTSRFGGQAAEEMMQPGGAAFGKLVQLVEREGLTPEQAAARMQELGPEGMLLDLGENTSAAAEALANAPGEAGSIIRRSVQDRFSRGGQRVQTALDKTMGPTADLTATRDAMIAAKEAEAAQAYGTARAVDPARIQSDNALMSLLRHPDVDAASKIARQNVISQLALDNPDIDPKMIEQLVDARFVDEVDRALKSTVSSAYGSTDSAVRARANALKAVSDRFRQEADRVLPELRDARNLFAGRAELEGAFDDGLNVFRRQVRPDALAKELAGKTDSERVAFQQAARIALEDVFQQNNNDALGVIKALGPEWNRAKLRLVVGDDAADELLATLDIEKGFQNQGQRITQNSRTAARQAAQQDLGIGQQPEGLGPLTYGYVAGGLPGAGRQALVHGIDQLLGSRAGTQADRMRTALAQALAARGPDAARLVSMVSEATGMPTPPPAVLARALLGTVTPGTTSAGNSAVNFLNPKPNP